MQIENRQIAAHPFRILNCADLARSRRDLNLFTMIGTVLEDRYKVIRELKPEREGKIFYVVTDGEQGKMGFNDGCKSFLDDAEKMLKGIALFGKQQEEEADLEISLLQRLGNLFGNFLYNQEIRPLCGQAL